MDKLRASPSEPQEDHSAVTHWVEKPAGPRFRDLYPEDGLVLRVHSRDLPRDDKPDDWRAEASNRDFAWFRTNEVSSMLPAVREVNRTQSWPFELAARIARLHLVDNVRGQVRSFDSGDVRQAEITTTVLEATDDYLTLRFDGHFHTVARDTTAVDGFADRNAPAERERGFEGNLLGKGRYDLTTNQFISIEWVVAGLRHGGTQYNARADDLGHGAIGFVFTLADSTERTEPATFWKYGWR